MSYPNGYWTAVYTRATKLMDDNPHLDSETAYWFGRRQVDDEIEKKEKQLTMFRKKYPEASIQGAIQ